MRNILIIVVLLSIGGVGIYFLFFRSPSGDTVEFTNTPKSTFDEKNEYVNKQAQFSIQYPNTWNFEIKEIEDPLGNSEHDETTKGIRLRGQSGYIDLYWGESYEKGGCTQKVSQLQIADETIDVCNFVQDDNSEIWNQIVKDRGELIFWANVYAASPSAQTRNLILEVFSTLKFLE